MKSEFFTKPCSELNLRKVEKRLSGSRQSLKRVKQRAHRSERRVAKMILAHWEE